jgi:acetate kinase
MNAYRIKKYIGSGGHEWPDAIIFTAGIGENSSYMRKLVCTDMDYFGIHLDEAKVRSKELREIPLNLRLKFWSFRQMKS